MDLTVNQVDATVAGVFATICTTLIKTYVVVAVAQNMMIAVAQHMMITVPQQMMSAAAQQMMSAVAILIKNNYINHKSKDIAYFFYLRIKIESIKIRNIIYIIIMLFLFLWYLP